MTNTEPPGYREWSEWAQEQLAKGERQKQCPICKKWCFPVEGHSHPYPDCGGKGEAEVS